MRPHGFLLLLTVGLVGVACRGDASPGGADRARDLTPDHAVEANATVLSVVDGDTIDAAIDTPDGRVEERIRLIGIDTPETVRPDTPVECYGPESTAFVERLLPAGTPVRIERDVVGRDDFGRLLGYVHRASDGLFVNLEIVRTGHATPLSIEPNTTFRDDFVAAARAAERDDLGLWAACAG